MLPTPLDGRRYMNPPVLVYTVACHHMGDLDLTSLCYGCLSFLLAGLRIARGLCVEGKGNFGISIVKGNKCVN